MKSADPRYIESRLHEERRWKLKSARGLNLRLVRKIEMGRHKRSTATTDSLYVSGSRVLTGAFEHSDAWAPVVSNR